MARYNISGSVTVLLIWLLAGAGCMWSSPYKKHTGSNQEQLDCRETVYGKELKPLASITANQVINTQLTAKTVNKCVNGNVISLKSYIDNQAGTDERPIGPAYILNVDPESRGPQINLLFSNALDNQQGRYDCSHHSPDVAACTNLHTHGFHVSPHGSTRLTDVQSDYVFITIPPTTQKVQYQFNVPNTHAPGTHWLHAHLHGSTAPQVKDGMAGALILKGALDETLATRHGITKNKDKILLLSQMEDKAGKPLCGKNIFTSINGQCLPVINVQAREVNRWRLIHAGVSQTINLILTDQNGRRQPLHEFARDGITLNGYQTQTNIALQPGYRSDVLVQFPTCVHYPCEMYLVDGETPALKSLWGVAETSNRIATIIINKGSANDRLPPGGLFTNPYPFICEPSDFKNCSNGLAQKKVWFASVNSSQTANGAEYPDNGEQRLTLNERTAWRIWVGEEQTNDANHPFHIHVNPFQVVDTNGFSYWKDTLLISNSDNKGEENAVTVVSQQETFTGEFVLHCHNLNHEDSGMMMKVVITE